MPESDGIQTIKQKQKVEDIIANGGVHICKEHENVYAIAQLYQVTHWQTIWEHPNNQSLRDSVKNPWNLVIGSQVYVPKQQAVASHTELACELEKINSFKLRAPAGVDNSSIEDDDAQEAAERCARSAYEAVVNKGENTWSQTLHDTIHNNETRYGYYVAAAGIVASVIVGVALGSGVGFLALAGAGAGVYLFKKLLTHLATQQTLKKLRRYHENRPLRDERSIGLYSLLNSTRTKETNKRRDEYSDNARNVIRKSIVHFRYARELSDNELDEDDFLKDPNSRGSDMTCHDVIAEVKLAMKFLHHYHKFQNYLVPCIDSLVFFIDAYEKFVKNFEASSAHVDASIKEFMKKSRHQLCHHEKNGICFMGSHGVADNLINEHGREKNDEHAKGVGVDLSLSTDGEAFESRGEIEVKTVTVADIRKRVLAAADAFSDEVEAYKKTAGLAVYDENGKIKEEPKDNQKENKRYVALITDTFYRYDQPSFGRQFRHKIKNWNYTKTRVEKGFEILLEGIDIALAFGGDAAFETEVGGKVTDAAETYFYQGMYTLGTTLLSSIVVPLAESKAEEEAKKGSMYSSLLSNVSNKARMADVRRQFLEGIDLDIGFDKNEQDLRGQSLKSSGKALVEIFAGMANHMRRATNDAHRIAPKTRLVTCTEALRFCYRYYKFRNEIDLLGQNIVMAADTITSLLDWGKQLSTRAKEIIERLDANIEPWIKDSNNHTNCCSKHKYCYGPSDKDANKPKKPLSSKRDVDIDDVFDKYKDTHGLLHADEPEPLEEEDVQDELDEERDS